MGVVIESSVWEPSSSVFVFIFACSFFSILLLPYYSKNRAVSTFDHGSSSSFLRFQRYFMFLYSLSSVMEGLWSVFGEFELAYFGVSKEGMVFYLCCAYAAAFFFGPLLGVLSDVMGQRRVCLLFSILHLSVGVWKRITTNPSVWVASICLSLATSIFSFSFETWVVVEHEKQGQRKEALSDTFWVMIFSGSASLIVSQMLGNWLVGTNVRHGITSCSTVSIVLAIVNIICTNQAGKDFMKKLPFKDYSMAFCSLILSDKRIWLLAFSQACLQFTDAVFWILWAPTVVADGREVSLGLILPCLMGARMLGSTLFPWVVSGPLSIRAEDFLAYIFSILGFILSIVAYDYQEIKFLVAVFCLCHAGVGLVLPLLANLRTMYVPNELRGGMISLSHAPANAATLFFLIQRGYYHNIENSTIMAFSAISLFMAAAFMYLLKQIGKQPHQDWHKL